MAKRYYVKATEAHAKIMRITRRQAAANCFVNVTVKPYKGKKYNRGTTVVIVVG